MNEGDQISLTMTNESTHDLIFYHVVKDTLNAKLQKVKTSDFVKFPIERIEKVKVEKVNLPLTLILSGIFIGVSTIIVVSTLSYGSPFSH